MNKLEPCQLAKAILAISKPMLIPPGETFVSYDRYFKMTLESLGEGKFFIKRIEYR